MGKQRAEGFIPDLFKKGFSDLERAIEVYRGILAEFPGSRPVGKAQPHVDVCHEKLGLREAQNAVCGSAVAFGARAAPEGRRPATVRAATCSPGGT